VALLQPCDVVDDGCCSGLDAAVIAIDRRILTDLRVREAPGLLLFDEEFDILAQRALIAFQRET